ncbi:MAG: DUF6597 domain-containing transcriptional factor [Actinomycetota bacterium]
MESYAERLPIAGLAGAVRTVWVQRTGDAPYSQRHLPTGGVEIHFPIGCRPQLVGPLTGPVVEVIAPHSSIVGVRFFPGAAPPLPMPLDDLVDQRIGLHEVRPTLADRLFADVTEAGTPEQALPLVQERLLREFRRASHLDDLVRAAVKILMPWRAVDIRTTAGHLALSESQLRRRCLQGVGLSPKALQRTLRFQGFLALAQSGAVATGRRGSDGLASLAVDVGYTDQAHLSRECLRLTGLTPLQLLRGSVDRCSCGHDHSASYRPYLATRTNGPARF